MRFARYITSVAVRAWPLLLILAMWLFIFWPMLIGKTVVGFRDSAYLYYPLFKWIDAQWAAGEIPLWNPYCNFGYPLVADGTSSVFYPGKLIFFCRFLSYPCRYGIYIAVHVPIAAMGAYWCARRMRAGKHGATIAAISYGFGGSVLFQTVNVVYLISAAWLPFALCCVWRMYRERSFTPAVLAGFFCSLMILGGDPQMVYMVGLIATATWLGKFRRVRKRFWRSKVEARTVLPKPYRWLAVAGCKLATMVLVTSCLAAIQILPTYVWAQKSMRSQPENAVNLYSAIEGYFEDIKSPIFLMDNWGFWHEASPQDAALSKAEALFVEPISGTQYEESFQFSQPPWSLVEMFMPNFYGKPFPINTRWGNSIPGADRVWTPSVYIGLLPIVVGLFGLSFFSKRRSNVWLTCIVLFFGFASFGWYGIGWLLREFGLVGVLDIGNPVGGIYWLMVMVLPKFYVFRYPAKLFVVASLALSLLAAKAMGQELNSKLLAVRLMFVSGLSLIAFLIAANFRFGFLESQDPLFGSVSFETVRLFTAFAHTLIVGLVLLAIARLVTHSQLRSVFLLLVVAVEILSANHWLVPQVNASAFESSVSVSRLATDAGDSFESLVRWKGFPNEWSRTSSKRRMDEIVRWQRETLYGKHHLERNWRRLDSFTSIEPSVYYRYLHLDFLGSKRNDGAEVSPSHIGEHGFRFHDLEDKIQQRVREHIERPDVVYLYDTIDRNSIELEGSFEILSCNRARVSASIESPGEISANILANRGWKATVENLDTGNVVENAQFMCGDVLMGARVPKGNVEVTFTYSPIEFWIGMWISIVSWSLLIVCMFVRIGRKQATAAGC